MNEKKDELYNFSQMFFVICLAFFGGWLLAIVKHPIQERDQSIQNKVSIGTQTGTVESGHQITGSERPITKSTSPVKQPAISYPKKNDNPEQKPISTNTGIITKVFIKDWKLAYNKVQNVVNNEEITKHILWACIKTRNQPHCVNSILGVSKAESSIFRNCYQNSCLGIKPKGQIKTYPSIKYGIDDFVQRYNKYWYANDNAKEWIEKSNYCNGDCELVGSNWRVSYDSFLNYIN